MQPLNVIDLMAIASGPKKIIVILQDEQLQNTVLLLIWFKAYEGAPQDHPNVLLTCNGFGYEIMHVLSVVHVHPNRFQRFLNL